MAQSDLDFSLDRDAELPLGTQLALRLRSLIAGGRLAEGERLPGVREMAEHARVNVNTVRSVYARLADEGAIVSEHGRGTFVRSRAAAEAALDKATAAFTGSEHLRAERGRDPLLGAREIRQTGEGSDPYAVLGSAAVPAEARRRASLRAEIALLERELAALEVPTNGESKPAGERAATGERDVAAARRDAPAPQLLTAADLESIRDELVERLRPLRADRASARQELEGERHERAQAELVRRPHSRQRAIATSSPKFETGAGGWSLRWGGRG